MEAGAVSDSAACLWDTFCLLDTLSSFNRRPPPFCKEKEEWRREGGKKGLGKEERGETYGWDVILNDYLINNFKSVCGKEYQP